MFHSRIRSFLRLLLLFWLSVGPAAGQTMRFVDTRNGLSSMFVLSLYQDVRGFVWAGTYSGLSVMDGNGSAVAFSDRPEVRAEAGVMVAGIDGTSSGVVWMKTNYGLDCRDMTSGLREHHTEFIGYYRVAVWPRGDVVVLTPDKGYFAYNALQHRFQKLTAELVADRDVHAMSIDSAGLWRVITRTHTLEATLVTEADGRVVTLPRKVPHAMGRLVTAKADADRLLMVDEQGVFYEGDASGRDAREVCRLSPELRRREPYAAILRDGDDYLLGFYSGGVFRLRRTSDGYVEEPTAVTCGIFDIRRDRQQDIIWVATDGEGVCCLAREPYLFYHELYADLPFKVSAPVRAILRDSGGDLWVATKGDGLLCYEGYMPVLKAGTDGLGFYPLTTTTTIKANTAYLPENRQLIIDLATLDSPMTGVQAAEMVNGKLSNGKCYDLSGREMVNARSAKEDASRLKKLPQGIYVTKKKKFVVKP